ncbi:hypothetical protein [Maribacter sp. 2308TA10-17]|uniref:hypothetical protein n=1 Tax=Maribacter sp. 2308TA10-17 TaxID=3386276 RepID=UPI0039BCE922
MKLNYKIFTTIALAAIVSISCTEGDKTFDDIVDAEQRGAVLRTINVNSNELPIGVSDGFFEVALEVQDQEDGKLVQSIDVFGTFLDNTPDNGKGATSSEALIETLNPASFELGDAGLPVTTYRVELSSLLSTTGVSDADIDGGDEFAVRFELVMTDGRRFSNGQNSGTLTGSYFSSPFRYTAIIVCPPKAPTPGVWTINMTDSYGDGWQTDTGSGGAGITVTLDDGTVLEVGMCSPYGGAAGTFLGGADCTPNDGSVGVGTITIPDGTLTADWFFPGDRYGEIGYEILTPNGNVVGGYQGVEAGSILINFCLD